jgi:hypothetical protein
MRNYKNLPNPEIEVEEFNEYLRKNNEVIFENNSWIAIKNSYIDNQLVIFCKFNVKYITNLTNNALVDLRLVLSGTNTAGKHIYINADSDKSVANRLHLHIKL